MMRASPPLPDRRHLALVAAGVVLIAAAHFLANPSEAVGHRMFGRLYFLPIVGAAVVTGLSGGLMAALLATIAYLPAVHLLGGGTSASTPVELGLEVVTYFVVASLAGLLADRARQTRAHEARTALRRRAAEVRSEWLSGVVHLSQGLALEIRKPLRAIQHALETLTEGLSPTSPRSETAAQGLEEVGRLDRVLSDFLSFAGPREPDLGPLDPGELIQKVSTELAPEANDRGVRVIADSGDVEVNAIGDEEQLQQALTNLVRNAIEATHAGGEVTLQVVLCHQGDAQDPERVVIEVHDTGHGVPNELGDSIYEPYVTGREEGRGLGLPVASLIVRLHGGLLTHEPAPEGGTVFRFDLAAED